MSEVQFVRGRSQIRIEGGGNLSKDYRHFEKDLILSGGPASVSDTEIWCGGPGCNEICGRLQFEGSCLFDDFRFMYTFDPGYAISKIVCFVDTFVY